MSGQGALAFRVHGLFALPDLRGVAGVARAVATAEAGLRTTYHDAPDLRLARAGVALTHEVGAADGDAADGAGVPGPAGARWVLALGDGTSEAVPADGAVAHGPPPAALLDLATAALRGAEPAEVAVLRTDRATVLLLDDDGTEVARVVDDTLSVLEHRRVVARSREVVLRAAPAAGREAGTALLGAVAARLVAAGAEPVDPVPRLVTALGPRATAPPDTPEPAPVGRRDPAAVLVAGTVRDALRRLVAADPGVRRGREDAVHQMRVACRRLRSDLGTLGPLVEPAAAGRLAGELRWLADALGGARDLEVLRARLRRTAAADPLAPLDPGALARVDALLARQEEQAQASALAAVRCPRYVALLDDLVRAAAAPPVTPLAAAECRDVLPPLVARAWSRLAAPAARLDPDGDDDPWHRTRIRAKRARYAAEAVAPALGGQARRLAAAAESVQEVLGEHQDAAVAADRVLALADEHPGDPALLVTLGRLVERERAAVRRARERFPGVWKAARKGHGPAWLAEEVEAAERRVAKREREAAKEAARAERAARAAAERAAAQEAAAQEAAQQEAAAQEAAPQEAAPQEAPPPGAPGGQEAGEAGPAEPRAAGSPGVSDVPAREPETSSGTRPTTDSP